MQLWQSFYFRVPLETREMANGSGRGDIYQTSWPVYGLQLDRVMSDRCAPMRVKTGSDNPDMGFELQSLLKGHLRAFPICFQTWHPIFVGVWNDTRTMEFSIITFPSKKCGSMVLYFLHGLCRLYIPAFVKALMVFKDQNTTCSPTCAYSYWFFQCICLCKTFLKESCKICSHSLPFLSTPVKHQVSCGSFYKLIQ